MEQNYHKKMPLIAFSMITSGILLFGEIIYGQYNNFFNEFPIDTFLVAILFIISALFLLKNKKWAWFVAIVLSAKEAVAGINSVLSFFYHLDEQATILAPIFSFFIIVNIISFLICILSLTSLIFLIRYKKINA